jgi:hypothetical protein
VSPTTGARIDHDLRGGFLAALFLEEDVVGGVGVEGWVEVNQINARVRDVVAKNFQVIAKIELVLSIHFRRAYHNPATQARARRNYPLLHLRRRR